MDIIERAYKPQHKADKIKSIYMQHYDDIVRLLNYNYEIDDTIYGICLIDML